MKRKKYGLGEGKKEFHEEGNGAISVNSWFLKQVYVCEYTFYVHICMNMYLYLYTRIYSLDLPTKRVKKQTPLSPPHSNEHIYLPNLGL